MNDRELPRCITSFSELEEGKLWVDPEYLPHFHKYNLNTFSKIMQYQEGKRYKKNKYREVIRLEFEGMPALFLKRHFSPRKMDSCKRWLKLQKTKTSARLELEAISHLQEFGISTMRPIAFGEIHSRLFEAPSFVITQELKATKLEYYSMNGFPRWEKDIKFRHLLTEKIANLARTLHQNNIHHQDFYLCHILIQNEDSDDFKLYLIDLQRMRREKRLRKRWLIKDIAQLNYSALAPVVNHCDRLRFFQKYLGRQKLTREDIRWIYCIQKRNTKTARHMEKKKNRKNRN